MSDSKYGLNRRQSIADSRSFSSSSFELKRSTPVNGTSSSSAKKKSDMKNNSRDDIVNMRLEIMQSLRRSPTKLYDDDDTSKLPQIKQSEGALKLTAHKFEPPLSKTENFSTGAFSHTTNTRITDDLQDDLLNQAVSAADYVENNLEDHEMRQDMKYETPDNKLSRNTENALDASPVLAHPNIMGSVRSQVPKRVLSRHTSPEKIQSNLPTKVQITQHPRKKTRNSPPIANSQLALNQNIPTGLPQRSVSTTSASSYGPDKSQIRPTPLTSEIAKMNITKKSINRAVSSTGHRLPSSGRLHHVDKFDNTMTNEDISTFKHTSSKRHQNLEELIPRNEYSIIRKNLKSKSSNVSLHRSTSTSFKQTAPHEEESEVEEIEVRESKNKFENKEEVNIINSPSLDAPNNGKFDSQDISKLKAQHATEMASLHAQLAGKDTELAKMKEFMLASEQKALDSERHLVDSLEKVAKELHSQYSLKHETKVQALKKQHSNALEQKLQELQELRDQVEELEAVVEQERLEKDELVKMCDMYLEMEEQRLEEEDKRKRDQGPKTISKSSLQYRR